LDTNTPLIHQRKSPQAHEAVNNLLVDLKMHPLGSQRGENFSMPSNYRIPPARIYVINHSRTQTWTRLTIPVSALRGAEDALLADKELSKVYNVDTLVKQVEKGRDMSRYKTGVHPIAFKLRIPGDYRIVPPAETAESKPIAVEVPEGTWDLYLGNYDRMRGIVRDGSGNAVKEHDNQVIGEERTRLALAWSRRHNPVRSFTDDGETSDLGNKYGVLEFVRVTQRAVLEPVDRAYLTSLDLVEI